MATVAAPADELRMRINVKTKGMQRDVKRQWLSDFIARWAPGTHRLTPQQFVGALGSLGIDRRTAESLFSYVDADRNGYVDMHELNAVVSGQRLATHSARARAPEDNGLLKGYSFATTDSTRNSSGHVTTLQEGGQKEAKAFFHKIGTRLQEKGFKNINRVILELDPDDSGEVTSDEMAFFFTRYLNLGKDYANKFFNLLDCDGSGTICTKDVARRLQPYLQKGFACEAQDVGEWFEEEQSSPGHGMATTMKPEQARALDARSKSMQELGAQRPAGAQSNASTPMGSRRGSSGVLPGMDQTGSTCAPGTPMQRSRDMAPAGFSSARSNASSMGSRGGYPAGGNPAAPRSPGGGQLRGQSPIPEDSRAAPARRSNSARGPQLPQGPPHKVDVSEFVLEGFRKTILKRGGAHGIHTLGRTFRIMDTNRNRMLSSEELEIGLGRFGLHMQPRDLHMLVVAVDKNGTGTISYDEFMVAIRGQINERRQKLIMMAFDTLDRTRNGRIEADDVANAFDANHHPEVMSGSMHAKHALGDFLSQFDCLDHDGCITKKEFLEYYKNVSASIDDDDYFELMIRNAWHIAGGKGWCANTSNKRILVTFNDGKQKVVEIEHDMGQDLRNHAVVQKLLDQQGVRNVRSWKLSG